MRVRSLFLRAAAALGLALTLIAAVSLARAAVTAAGLERHWQDRRLDRAAPNAFRLVAFGDSVMVGVGADHPDHSIAGRIAAHVEQHSGRPVHVSNVSRNGGLVADLLAHQVPRVNLAAADLVVVSASTDMETGVPVDRYRADLERLASVLPAERTVISDLPLWPWRDRYQQVLAEVMDARGIRRADFATVFETNGRRLDIFSWLPPHLNGRGYGLWVEAFRPHIDRILAQRTTPP
jgi:lysophospholipase L1-like esterase